MTLNSFGVYVNNKLSTRWEIKRITITQETMITKETMRIVTNLPTISREMYLKMIGSVLLYLSEFPQFANQLMKIVFLDKWERGGWTFEAPERYNEIAKTPVKNLESKILSYTHRVI